MRLLTRRSGKHDAPRHAVYPPRLATLAFWLIAVIGPAMTSPDSAAAQVRGIRTPIVEPIVVRPWRHSDDGAVILLPLTAERDGNDWPATLPLTLPDRREVIGRVVWVTVTDRLAEPVPMGERGASYHDEHGWTAPLTRITLRPVEPGDRAARLPPPLREGAKGWMRSDSSMMRSTHPLTPSLRGRGNTGARRDGTFGSARGGAYLVAELPGSAEPAEIHFQDQTLHLQWVGQRHSPSGEDARLPDGQAFVFQHRMINPAAADLMRLRSPAIAPHPQEYWRRVLLAERLGEHLPEATGSEAERLIARHVAGLWRSGLERVRRHSAGIADHLQHQLTRICRDGDARPPDGQATFAAWVSDPSALDELLSLLLNDRLHGDQLVEAALAWADEQERLMVWLESATQDHVRLAIINPTFRPMVAQLRWDVPDEIPIAAELPAGELTRVRYERPARQNANQRDRPIEPYAAEEQHAALLTVEAEGKSVALVVGSEQIPVRPPGVFLPDAVGMLTLAAVQAGRVPQISRDDATYAQVRRLQGRWEMFFECRRPAHGNIQNGRRRSTLEEPQSGTEVAAATTPSLEGGGWGVGEICFINTALDPPPDPLPAREGESARPRTLATTLLSPFLGSEAVALFIGEGDRSAEANVVLLVPENGWHTQLRGPADDTLRIHRRSFEDRWYCRIVLPEKWLRTLRDEVTHIGVMRLHSGSDAVTSSPMPVTPWRLEPGRLSYDLTHWDDVPKQ